MLELSPTLKSLTAVAGGGKLVTSELFKAFRSGAALILTGRVLLVGAKLVESVTGMNKPLS